MKNSVYLQLALIAGSLVLLVFLVLNQQPPMETVTPIVLRDGEQEIEVLPAEGGEDTAEEPEGDGAAPSAVEAAPGESSAAPAPMPKPRKRAPRPVDPASQPAPVDPASVIAPGVETGFQPVGPSADEAAARAAARRQMGLPPEEPAPNPAAEAQTVETVY